MRFEELPKAVSCGKCELFIPDKVGFGDGIGNCKELEAYKLKKPSSDALERAKKSLGGKLLYPAVERRCNKFKRAENEIKK